MSFPTFQAFASRVALIVAALGGSFALGAETWPQAGDERAVGRALAAAGFDLERVSFLAADARGGRTRRVWSEIERAVSPGSLLKPFVAAAYAANGAREFPVLECAGAADRCWLPAGHGRVGLEEALAESCNVYFRRLAEDVSAAAMRREATLFGLGPPPSEAPRDAWWGLGEEWRIAPAALIGAYRLLVERGAAPSTRRVLRGLRRAARSGTARATAERLPLEAYSKTGTARCVHPSRADGDGFAVTIYPADSPRYTILLRIHGMTGRRAAEAAAIALGALPASP